MTLDEQLSILRQGVKVWNTWRRKNPGTLVDFSGIDFTEADFCGIDFNCVRLQRAKLCGGKLSKAYLNHVDLAGADLRKVSFKETYLTAANLNGANLDKANLDYVNLDRADLRNSSLQDVDLEFATLNFANLRGANLSRSNLNLAQLFFADLRETKLQEASFLAADLTEADLGDAILKDSYFSIARVGHTNFTNLDLSEAVGLEHVAHQAPSKICTGTLFKSKGKIPEVFLRGCGLSDWEIELARLYSPELNNAEIIEIQYKMYDMRANRALQISPLFISYIHADDKFVDKIGVRLQEIGVRYWRDVHDMKAGRIETQIDQAISKNRIILLVLSQNSLKSDWVQHEVRTAREEERKYERDKLCPVALDDSWKSGRWPKRLMEQIMEYNILDFSEWEDDKKFDGMFRKLIDGLELFYKG